MEAVWAHVERRLCPCLWWVELGPCRAMLGPSWAYIGPGWAMLGPSCAHVGPMLGPCWPMLALCGPMLSHLGIVRCQSVLPGPKPRKNRGFVASPRWNPLLPKGPKHRKKTMFLNIASKKHRKLRRLRLFGGGSAAGQAAPITFGYHRRPPARTRAPWPAPGFKGLSRKVASATWVLRASAQS